MKIRIQPKKNTEIRVAMNIVDDGQSADADEKDSQSQEPALVLLEIR